MLLLANTIVIFAIRQQGQEEHEGGFRLGDNEAH